MAQTRIDWSADDSMRIAFLRQHGVRVERNHVIVWAPRDTLPRTRLEALADSLDRGFAAMRHYIGAPYSWQRLGGNKVTYYLAADRFISHATTYNAVFIPVSRVREGTAPLLHEAAHVLLMPNPPYFGDEFADSTEGRRLDNLRPLWLTEGLADVVAQAVWPVTGPFEGDVFNIGGLARVHQTCAVRVQGSQRGAEVTEWIGSSRRPDALFTTDRQIIAPIFYACAQSFTWFLVGHVGVRAITALMPATKSDAWVIELERAAGATLTALRGHWLQQISAAR
jgi:hypothetical protein